VKEEEAIWDYERQMPNTEVPRLAGKGETGREPPISSVSPFPPFPPGEYEHEHEHEHERENGNDLAPGT
jgi:hypothetical protein